MTQQQRPINIQKHWNQAHIACEKAFELLKKMNVEEASYISLPTIFNWRDDPPIVHVSTSSLLFPWKAKCIRLDVKLYDRTINATVTPPNLMIDTTLSFDDILKLDIPNELRVEMANRITKAVQEKINQYDDEDAEVRLWRQSHPELQKAITFATKILAYVKESCNTCADKEVCQRPIRSMASDEELDHIICLSHRKAETKKDAADNP